MIAAEVVKQRFKDLVGVHGKRVDEMREDLSEWSRNRWCVSTSENYKLCAQ